MPSKAYRISAYTLGRSIDLAGILKHSLFNLLYRERNLLVFNLAHGAHIFVFSFGSAAFFNIDEKDEKKYLKILKKFVQLPFEKYFDEEFSIEVNSEMAEGVTSETMTIKSLTLEKLIIAATILVQSTAIEHISHMVDDLLIYYERINQDLELKGRLTVSNRELLKTLGLSGNLLQQILSRLSLLDKPDITWESAELESLFSQMNSMFDLGDRFKAIEYKLDFIENNSKTLLTILSDRKAKRLEWIIIILIFFEIVLFIFELLR